MFTDCSTSRCVRAMLASRPLVLTRGLLFQGRQPDIDARQSLGDDIMQFAADLLALFLLRRQNLAGQQPQLFLHLPRLLQQLAVVLLAFPEGFLRQPAPGDFLFQLPVGKGQVHGALAQRVVDLLQVEIGLAARCDASRSIGVMTSAKKAPARRTNDSRVP